MTRITTFKLIIFFSFLLLLLLVLLHSIQSILLPLSQHNMPNPTILTSFRLTSRTLSSNLTQLPWTFWPHTPYGNPQQSLALSILTKILSSPQTFQLFHLPGTMPYMIGLICFANKQLPFKSIFVPYIISRRDMPSGHITYLLQLFLMWVAYCS